MSMYLDRSVLVKVAGDKAWWTTDYAPGTPVPVSGIYRCTGCGKEVTSNHGNPFPPQTHHMHTDKQGDIRWHLNVRTSTDGTQ